MRAIHSAKIVALKNIGPVRCLLFWQKYEDDLNLVDSQLKSGYAIKPSEFNDISWCEFKPC